MLKLFEYNSRRAKATTLGNGRRQWRRWWLIEMATAMANSDGDRNGHWQGQRQRQWLTATQRRWRRWWLTETTIAIADGNSNSNGDSNGNGNGVGNGDIEGDGDRNGNGHSEGNHYKGRVASSCAGNVQHYGRGDTLPPPPWTQKEVHSPALHHESDTAKSVCSPSRGRVPDSSPWIVSLFIFYNYCSVYWTTLCSPPKLFRRSRTLSAHWRLTSSTPPRTSLAYWESTPAPIALLSR